VPQGKVRATSINEFEHQLTKIIGVDIARSEIKRALSDLGIDQEIVDIAVLPMLRAQINRNLSGLVGPVLSRMIVNQHLQIDRATKSAIANTIQFVENKNEKTRSKLEGVSSELDTLRRFHFQVLQDLPLGVVSVSEDNRIVSWNNAMARLTGIEQKTIIAQSIDNIPAPWQNILVSFISNKRFQISKLKTVINKELHLLNLFKAVVSHDQKQRSGIVILIEDHSERYSLEEKLAHNERLASIGQLATGVAHEIGNPVTGIACLAQDLQSEPNNTSIIQQGLEQILTQTKRIDNIVRSLVNFSHTGNRLDDHSADPVCLRHTIDEAIQLVSLNHSSPPLTYDNQCDESIYVLGYSQKLIQVFVNLLSNATDASSQQGGKIEIQALAHDNTVITSVRDYGKGIEKKHLAKIFEPFFTTKPIGEGTGLGLSLTYNIVQEHGGSISAYNKDDDGCQFEVSLPRFRPTNNI